MNLEILNQMVIDQLSPKPRLRWGVFSFVLALYLIRVWLTNSHQIITYCVGVYFVHGFILWATPKGQAIPDPFANDEDEDDYNPSNISNDLRPFIRNLPEYSYWLFCMKTISISFFLTFFSFTDIPVFTPILVVYLALMVFATINKLYIHSKKYHYNPFFQSKEQFKD